jgi:hypothetical protein
MLVGTFQTALSIDAELWDDPARRELCFARFGAALVDEGHAVPAISDYCRVGEGYYGRQVEMVSVLCCRATSTQLKPRS